MRDSSHSAGRSPSESPPIIVGIGASAGGLEAMQAFLAALPPHTGLAFVIVQHLDPAHPSLMPELLRKHTRMPVLIAEHGMRVEAERLYVMPSNVTLTIQGGVLQSTTPIDHALVRTTVDTFLRSLAADQSERAIGVVLSGTGSDGSLGLKAIKELGGITIVQSPTSAKYDSMPRNAVATGVIDFTLEVESIPTKLIELVEFARHIERQKTIELFHAETMEQLPRICRVLHQATGHDFSGYKPNTLVRRIERRMQFHRIDSVPAYLDKLEHDPVEAGQLFQEILIGVTQFFRDPEAFEALAREVIAELLRNKENDAHVRVWVPGCSTGEEAYSIAILLREEMSRLKVDPVVQVFATDIDDESIELARSARYPASLLETVTPERRERFFTKHGDVYHVDRSIRDLCVFSTHNVVRDPPFSALDLISCRNLFIYLDADLQSKLVPLFHYALAPGGYLFLGSSEGLTDFAGHFREVDKKHRILRRVESVVRTPLSFPLSELAAPHGHPLGSAKLLDRKQLDLGAIVSRIAAEYAPPCVVIDERAEIVYSSGETSLYLQHPTGATTLNLIEQVRKPLRFALRTAIRQALKSGESIVHPGLTLRTSLGTRGLDLVVRPLHDHPDAPRLFVVIFQPMSKPHPAASSTSTSAADSVVEQLEAELKTLRAELQSTVEELETANEELKSSNEELLSMNEEMQSSNEELQSSKEELQSLNEELATVNTELRLKVEQLDAANADLHNLFRSTEIATLFLDRGLRIKRFTPAAMSLFHLVATDIGRPITDFALRFADRDLTADIRDVLATLTSKEFSAHSPETSAWSLVRILPARTHDNSVDGVVVTLSDITALKQAEQALLQRDRELQTLTDNIPDVIGRVDRDLRHVFINRGITRLTGKSVEEYLGKTNEELGYPSDLCVQWNATFTDVFRTGEARSIEFNLPTEAGTAYLSCHVVPEFGADGAVESVVFATRDVTSLKRAEEAMRGSESKYHALFETMIEGFCVLEVLFDDVGKAVDYVFVEVNPAFAAQTGLENARGKRIRELVPEHESHWFERYGYVARTGESARFEAEAKGLHRYYDVSAYRLGGDGSHRVAVLFYDISERRRTEDALRDREHFLHRITDVTPSVLSIYDLDERRTVFINNRVESVLGYSPSEIHSMRDRAATVLMHPEDLPRFTANLERVRKLRDNEIIDFEYRVRDKRGEWHWFRSRYAVFARRDDHSVRQAIAAAIDITERKQAEELLVRTHDTFFSLIQNTPFGMYLIDADFRLRQVSLGAQKVFETVRPLLGRDFSEVLHTIWPEPFASQALERFRHTLETGEPYSAPSTIEQREDTGVVEAYDWRIERVMMPDGRNGVVCYFYDLSERQQWEATLRSADRRKDEFLATLAHELRNPLAPLRNSLELMKRSKNDPRFLESSRITMERQVGHMVRLVDDLLDVSRISRNKLELKLEDVELSTIVHEVIEGCRPEFERYGHELHAQISATPIHLRADPVRLAQVLTNILNNACKYTEPGGHVSLTTALDGDHAVVTIQDDGLGIPPEMLTRVFDMFAQVDRSLERSDGGLGIGLSLVKRLVELHGGTVEAFSEGPGRGSEFVVRLPARTRDAARIPEATAASAPEQSSAHRMLVVDDNQDSAETLAMLLALDGNEVRIAHDGAEAVEIAKQFKPAVILLDIGLPRMSGYEVCAAIRKETWGKSILIVAMTGWGQDEDRRKSAAAGFDVHMVKPLQHDDLRRVLVLMEKHART